MTWFRAAMEQAGLYPSRRKIKRKRRKLKDRKKLPIFIVLVDLSNRLETGEEKREKKTIW